MYCSACGTQLNAELNYCSRCGQRVTEKGSETASVAESMASSLGYVGAAGFFSYIFVAMILMKNGMPPGQLIAVTFFYFAALFGICFLILRQTELLAGKKGKRTPAGQREAEPPAACLRPVNTARLREPSANDTIGSVVEHTTRTLDKTPIERN